MLQVKNLTDLSMKLLSYFFDKHIDLFVYDLIKNMSCASKSIETENGMVFHSSSLMCITLEVNSNFCRDSRNQFTRQRGSILGKSSIFSPNPNPWVSISE